PVVRAFAQRSTASGSATPSAAGSASLQRAGVRSARQRYHAPAGSANATASDGRMVAAMPKPSPLSSATQGRGVSDFMTFASAAMAITSQVSTVTWFMYEPAMNAVKGANARSSSAPSAMPGRGSAMRTYTENASTVMAPNTGPTSQGACSSTPMASMAGPPMGNWAK